MSGPGIREERRVSDFSATTLFGFLWRGWTAARSRQSFADSDSPLPVQLILRWFGKIFSHELSAPQNIACRASTALHTSDSLTSGLFHQEVCLPAVEVANSAATANARGAGVVHVDRAADGRLSVALRRPPA